MVHVGKWLGKCGSSIACPLCSSPIETLRHYFGDCFQAQMVWDKVTRLVVACEVEGTTLWGETTWIDLSVDCWMDAFNLDTWCYECTRGKLVKTQFERGLKTAHPRFQEIKMLIAGFTLWYAWKARCRGSCGSCGEVAGTKVKGS